MRNPLNIKLDEETSKNLSILAHALATLADEPEDSFIVNEGDYGTPGVVIESSIWYNLLNEYMGAALVTKLDEELKKHGLYYEPVNSWLVAAYRI